jgi:SAM-dependent methyltransferase
MATIEGRYDEIWADVPVDRDLPDWDLRAAFCLSLAERGERVLDLGCGDGPMLPVLADAGCTVAGADPSRVALERAAGRGSFTLYPLGADGRVPCPDASFDGIWASEVVGQAEDADAVLAEAARLLRPGGWIGLTTPASAWPVRLGLAGRDSTTRRHFSRRSLAGAMRRAGFERIALEAGGGLPGLRHLILANGRRA